MAEFTEVMKQRKRMCEEGEQICRECKLYCRNNEKNLTCLSFMVEFPQEAEEIIMAWAKEHPIQTNADKFEEVFGFIPDSECCPSKCPENGCINCEYRHFWSQEYKEPKKGETE